MRTLGRCLEILIEIAAAFLPTLDAALKNSLL